MKNYLILLIFFYVSIIFSQERQKIDGVAAVIGDFVVLESDIDKQFTQLKVSGVSMEIFLNVRFLENFLRINYISIMRFKTVSK